MKRSNRKIAISLVLIVLTLVIAIVAPIVANRQDRIRYLLQNSDKYESQFAATFDSYEITKYLKGGATISVETQVNGENTTYRFDTDNKYSIYYDGIDEPHNRADLYVYVLDEEFSIFLREPQKPVHCYYSLNDLSILYTDEVSKSKAADAEIKRYLEEDTLRELLETGNSIRQTLIDMSK